MEGRIPTVFKDVVREFYFTLDFSKDKLKMTVVVKGKKFKFDVVLLERILRTVPKQKPSIEFL